MTRLFAAILTVLLALSGAVVPGIEVQTPVSAQSDEGILVYDYNGDGDVTCTDDFIVEFPSSYTEEATAALELFPEELTDLDRDDDGLACDPSGDDSGEDSAPVADEPLDIEPVPSDLPPAAVADPVPVDTVAAPAECDVIVENGRAFVYTDCADGTVRAGFQPFEGFDAFAARAQNGFGAFDDVASASDSATMVEVQQSLPATGPASGSASQESVPTEPRVVEGTRQVRDPKATKAKQAKALKAKKLKRAKERKAERDRLKRWRQRERRLAD